MSDIRVEVDMKKLEEFIRTIKPGKVVRILHDGVDYGIYNEFGTSRMAAHPFMIPAIEIIRPAFFKGLKQIRNLQMLEDFVDELATDAAGHARNRAPVKTSQLKNSIMVTPAERFTGFG